MSFNKKLIVQILLIILAPVFLNAQDERTAKTKVADVLALLPAEDNQQASRLYKELINLKDEGLMIITDGVQPNGNMQAVPYRYAVSILSHYATSKEEKASIEKIYLAALNKANAPEVKAYFIKNLELIGSDVAVAPLIAFATSDSLFDPAIGTLETIASAKAKEALSGALAGAPMNAKARIIRALGKLKYQPALQSISSFATSQDTELRKQSLWALAQIGDAASYTVLLEEARRIGFKKESSEATQSLIEYMHEQEDRGSRELIKKISGEILSNIMEASQQHFRLAALKGAVNQDPANAIKILSGELNRFDAEYRKEVLNIAVKFSGNEQAVRGWDKELKKSTGEVQGDLLTMLSKANDQDVFVETTLIPSLTSKNIYVRLAAAQGIGNRGNKKFLPQMISYLIRSQDENELKTAQSVLLQLTDKENVDWIAKAVPASSPKHQVILLQILKEKRASNHFDVVLKMTASPDAAVKKAAYSALPNVSAGKNVNQLISLTTGNAEELEAVQSALVSSMDEESSKTILAAYEKDKTKFLPVLPYLKDQSVLEKVVSTFNNGNEKEKEVAFDALSVWQDHEAARTLLSIRKDDQLKKYHERAFSSFVNQVSKSEWPDDQKLLMLREAMSVAKSSKEKTSVLRAVGNLRTFLSLIFVSQYLEDSELNATAGRSAMQIALPSSDAKPGLTGVEVRNILQSMLDKLAGSDSQYEVIDITTYMEQLPYTKGFQSIFNGKDLTGWQGLVENPIVRNKMTKEVLAQKQTEANNKLKENWSVKDGAIVFSGDGANLCTTRPYGDFEMIVDWKISKNGDSGIYLRGSPQVQIWDTSRVDAGAQVGSGGLYNNKTNRSTPLVVADNPIGEWNTFNIKMIGDKVTVYLNGVLVVDNVVMENYWDRNLPIFAEEAIELQAHGTELAFRNIYVKELNTKPFDLGKDEKAAGFEILFNGKDLDNWVGNKTDYVVEDNTIAVYPSKESHGNLSTEKEYSDFIFRFEFQLTPGANNGLGIHAPLEGDAAYVGKEIQILDNTAPVYAKLEPYQYHGSVYGVMAAKRDFLKPVGEWNEQEVHVRGDYIKVTLNGTVIVEGDLKKATKNGTLDKKEHPGLNKYKGHISFLGHGTVVKFRNIRIKELAGK